MSDAAGTSHLRAEELLDYFEEQVPDARQRAIEEHLAACEACTALARGVHAFAEAWSWTAEEHGALEQRVLLARALEAADVEAPALGDRLRGWRRRWAGLAEAGLRVAVDASATTVRVVAEGIEALARPGSAWRFDPVPSTPSARGTEPAEHASALLATAVGPTQPRARVAVRGGLTSEVEVRVDDLDPDAPSPIVVLIRVDPDRPPHVRVAETELRTGAAYRIARFSRLPPGSYVVAFEPLAAREA